MSEEVSENRCAHEASGFSRTSGGSRFSLASEMYPRASWRRCFSAWRRCVSRSDRRLAARDHAGARPHLRVVGGGGKHRGSVGRDGVFLVDSGSSRTPIARARGGRRAAEDGRVQAGSRSSASPPRAAQSTLLEPYYRAEPPKPIRYIANTTFAPDHIGGNEKLRAAGKTFTGGNVAGEIDAANEGAAILGYEQLRRSHGDRRKYPTQALPTETFFGDHMKLSQFFNGEGDRAAITLPPRRPTATASSTSAAPTSSRPATCSGCPRSRRSTSRRRQHPGRARGAQPDDRHVGRRVPHRGRHDVRRRTRPHRRPRRPDLLP